ncbi:GPW/gp25 family protein [Marinobacterium jannaschii]|uniref:hypothetical protein n=1 Tax=Marinobacterium jannaschii TaxID=64970 RepID=UPI0004822962|nr:hypothetical protein [Marinobacterium jannaschii]
MTGICRKTGRAVSGWEHFKGLAEDVLTTQVVSRQRRRAYGSRLPELLGKLNSDGVLMQAQAYAAQAFADPVNKLVDQFALKRVVVSRTEVGLRLRLAGDWQGQSVSFEVDINANESK